MVSPLDLESTTVGSRPARKRTVKLHPVVGIILFSTPVVLLAAVLVLYFNLPEDGPEDPPPGPRKVTEEFKAKVRNAGTLYRTAINLRADDDTARFRAKMDEAKDAVAALLDEIDAMREEDKLPEHDQYYHQLQTWLDDLLKTGGF